MPCIVRLILLFLAPAILQASDEVPAPPQKRPIAIVGAHIHPILGTDFIGGTVLFDSGRIVALGQDIAIPAEAFVIEAAGRHVYPGLIAAHTLLGLKEIGAVKATTDYREIGEINAGVRAESSINPDSEHIPVTRANGVLLAVTAPAGGVLAGTSAMIMPDGWTWEDMTLKAPLGMICNWPDMRIRTGNFNGLDEKQQRAQRDAQLKLLADAFDDARAYMAAKQAESRDGVPYHAVDIRWEAMQPVLNREIPLVVVADQLDRIRAAVRFALEQQVRMVLVGGADAWMVADLLKQHNIPVIVSAVNRLPERRWQPYDTAFQLPRRLHEAGVRFAIANNDETNERHLAAQAAQAAAFGLPAEEALKAVTLYPAQIFGVDDRVGSLEIGKDATLIITTGNPLELTTQVERAFIQGRDIALTSRHTRLYEKYREKYRRLSAQ